MIRIFISFILLIFLSTENLISLAQNRAKIDSLLIALKKESNRNKKAEIYLALSEEYLPINSKSIDYANEAQNIGNKLGDQGIRIKAQIAIAKGKYLLLDNYEEAKQLLNESAKLCILNHLYDLQIQTLIEGANLEQHYNHYISALEKLHVANSISTQNHNKSQQIEISYRIADLHLQNKKNSDAIVWSSICDSLSRNSHDTVFLGYSYKIKALVNCNSNNYLGVQSEFRKVISLYKKYLKSNERSQDRNVLYINSLIDYANSLREVEQYDSSLYYTKKCLSYIRTKYGRDTIKYEPQHLMIQAHLANSLTIDAIEGSIEGRKSKDAIMEYLIEVNDTVTLSDAYYQIALNSLKTGPVTKALSYLSKYNKAVLKLGNPLKTVKGLNLNGLTYYRIGKYKMAIGTYKNALKISQENHFIDKQDQFRTCLSNAFLYTNNPDSAIFYAKISLKSKSADSLITYVNNYNISAAYLMKNDMQSVQHYINELINKSSYIEIPIISQLGIVATDFFIADYYQKKNNNELFLVYINKCILKSQKEEVKEIEQDCYLKLAKFYKSTGKYEKSSDYFEKYLIIKDEITNLYTTRLFTLYELSERTNERKTENDILKKEKEIKEAEIRHKEVIIIITVIALVIFIALSGMLIISNRKKKRLNRMLTAQAKEILEKNRLLGEQTIAIEESEAMIRKQNTELVNLNKTKDKFFSIIAHDLRNPFTGLIGLTNYLIDHVKEMKVEDTTKCLLTINESSRQTYILLENLLDWAQTQIGSIKYNPEVFDLSYVAENTTKVFNATSTIKGIKVSNKIETETWVFADKSMTETILRNLIGNAIKYTNSTGFVEISAAVLDGKVQIAVRDTGIGMNNEYLEKLFTLESINSRYGTAQEKGTGIGLVVCMEMIKKHNEKIWAESKPGEGATFYFTLQKMTL